MDAYHPEYCSWWGEKALKEFIEDKGVICYNIGWIVHEDTDMITLSSMVGGDGKSVSHIERIPKGCIIERTVLKKSKIIVYEKRRR